MIVVYVVCVHCIKIMAAVGSERLLSNKKVYRYTVFGHSTHA